METHYKIKITILAFCIFLPLFLLLFSYKIALIFFPLAPGQANAIQSLQGREGLALNYTAAERSHLQDVQKVMLGVEYVFYGLLLMVTVMLMYHRKDKKEIARLLKYGGLSTIIAVGLILLATLLSFNTSFTLFHQLFFPQGNWQFSAGSILIQTFPLEFFMRVGMTIFILAVVMSSIILFMATQYFSATRNP